MLKTLVLAAALLIPTVAEAQFGGNPPDLNVRMRGFRHRANLDTLMFYAPMPANADRTYRAALAVMDSLKIRYRYADSTLRMIHDPGFIIRGRMAGRNLGQFFHCGSGPSGYHADTWRMFVAYVIRIVPQGERSQLGLGVAAGAQDIDGASKAPVMCGTTGVLLRVIAEEVEAQLAR